MTLINVRELAALLKMNAAHVRDRLTKRADFPRAHRVGRSLRWKAEEVDKWIESRKLSPAARRPGRLSSTKD